MSCCQTFQEENRQTACGIAEQVAPLERRADDGTQETVGDVEFVHEAPALQAFHGNGKEQDCRRQNAVPARFFRGNDSQQAIDQNNNENIAVSN